MSRLAKLAFTAAAASSMTLMAPAASALPVTAGYSAPVGASATVWTDTAVEHKRGRRYRDGDYGRYERYAEPVYRDTRVWEGRDGQYRCRKRDGTTGLIIGGAAGALLGREIDKRGDRTLGTILGAAGGAILGKQIMGGVRCR